MNKLIRMLSMCLILAMVLTSMPVNALAVSDESSVPVSAEQVPDGELVPVDMPTPIEMPEPEVFAAPVQEAVVEEEPEMDLMEAMGLTEEGEPMPEPETSEEPQIMPEPEIPEEPALTPEPETTAEPGEPETGIEPEVSMEPEMDLVPEIMPEPENIPGEEETESSADDDMVVLSEALCISGSATEVAVCLPETAMPVADVEGLVCDADYYAFESGIILAAAWLNNLAPGEVLVCIHGADGILYVQPVLIVRQPVARENVEYDIVNLRVNGEDLFAGSGTNWSYDAETGVLTLTGESTVSGSGMLRAIVVSAEKTTLSDLVLAAEKIEASGMLIIDGTSEIELSGNGAGALTAVELNIEAGGRLKVEAAPEVSAFIAVEVKDRFINSGDVDIHILSGAAADVTGIQFMNYKGTNETVSIVNDQTNAGNYVYGFYFKRYYSSAMDEIPFESSGSVSIVNNQPCETFNGFRYTGGNERSIFTGVDIKNNATVSAYCTAIGSSGSLNFDEASEVNIVLQGLRKAGTATGIQSSGGAVFSGKVQVSISEAKDARAIDISSTANFNEGSETQIKVNDCAGTCLGIRVSQSMLCLYGGVDIRMERCNDATGVRGRYTYVGSNQKNGSLTIMISDTVRKAIGILKDSDATLCFNSAVVNIDMLDNEDSVGISGSVRGERSDAYIRILAKQLNDNGGISINGKGYSMKGFYLLYDNEEMFIANEYEHIEVDGVVYDVYPQIIDAKGDGWHFDAAKNTLTLDGSDGGEFVLSEGKADFTVNTIGDSKIESLEAYSDEVRFTGNALLRVDGEALDGWGGIFGKKIIFESGTYEIENCDTGIWGDAVEIIDADLRITNGSCGIKSESSIVVSESAKVDIRSGLRSFIAPEGCLVNGELLEKADGRVLIEGGRVVEMAIVSALCVGGRAFTSEQLSKAYSGTTWRWNPEKQMVILDGYEGNLSFVGGDLKVYLSSASSVTELYADNLTIDGTDRGEITVDTIGIGDLCIKNGDLTIYDQNAVELDDLKIEGGSLLCVTLKVDDSISLSGSGALVCDEMQAKSIDISGGVVGVYNVDTLKADTIRISGGEFATIGNVECASYEQSGGTVQLCVGAAIEDAVIETVLKAKNVVIEGGVFNATNLNENGSVIEAESILLKHSISSEMHCPGGIFNAQHVEVCGNADLASVKLISIVNGQIRMADVESEAMLTINGKSYSAYMLDNYAFGGRGWSWDPAAQTLTIENAEIDSINVAEKTTIYIKDGTAAFVKNGISGAKGLVVKGEGYLESDIRNESGSVTINGVSMYGEVVNNGAVTMSGVRMYYGAIIARGGSINLKNCDICCHDIYTTKNLTVNGTMIEAMAFAEEADAWDIYAGGTAKFTSSVLLGQNFKAKKITYDKYCALFVWTQYGYTLKRNCILNRTWVFPDRPYYIPDDYGISVSGGKKAVFLGDVYENDFSTDITVTRLPSALHLTGASEVIAGTRMTIEMKNKAQDWVKEHLVWLSSDPAICKVDKNGTVTVSNNPLYIGREITVTAVCMLTDDLTADFTFKIAPGAYEVMLLNGEKQAKEIELWLDPANKKVQLTHQVFPYDASQEVTWKSTKSKVASVTEDGVVVAKAAGTAYIYAVAADGTGVESQRVKVTVKKAPTSVKFTSSTATLGYDAEKDVGSSQQLKVKLSSGSASTITYKSSNTDIVTVDENGVITAKKAGKATITATTYNKKKATCKVTVKGAPDSIGLNKAEHVIGLGDEYTFTAKIPSGSYGNWTFSTSDAGKVSVDPKTGRIKAEAIGEAVITATTFNGRTDTCKVTVVPAPDGIMAPETLTLGKGESRYLDPVPTLTGDAATAASFTYASSNRKVVSVDKNGKLKALKTGKAVITITTHNDISVRCEVTVKKAPTSIRLSHKKGVLAYDEAQKLGTSYRLTAKLSSGSASAIKFTSSNEKVVKVDANGMLTAVGVGTAKIKASTFNKKSATCTVTVMAGPENMIFERDAYVVAIDDKITVKAQAEFGTYSPTCEYGSKDGFVAIVDKDTGVVTPVTVGKTTLIAKGFNGAEGTAEINVVESPEDIELNAYNGTLKKGKKFKIVPAVTRKDGKDTAASYTFTSSRPTVCSVSASGVLTGRKAGTAIITVTTHNGLTATVRVKVK